MGSVLWEDLQFFKFMYLNNRALKYMEQKLRELQRETDRYKIIVR